VRRWPFAAALLLAAATAAAQEMTAAHMEGCLVWTRDRNVAVRNECSRPLTLQYMDMAEQRVVATELAPGARFTTESVWGRTGGFMFTACPVGLKPSVRFASENQEVIAASLYNCVAGRPTS
jgi:hypothetical protein